MAATMRELKATGFSAHTKTVTNVQWSVAEPERVASASADTTARVWQVRAGAMSSTLELTGHKKGVMQLAWDASRAGMLATASNDRSVRFWDTRQAKCVASVETKGENINIAFARDGETVTVGDKKDQLSWIDLKSHKIVAQTSFPSETNEFGYTTDGSLFLATTGKGTVDVYRGDPLQDSFKRAASLPAHAASCYSLGLSPDGTRFAVGSADSLVSIWHRGELACERTIARFKAPVRAIGFNYDSTTLASGGEDGIIDIANAKDGSQLSSVKVDAAVNSLSWSPAANCLVYAADAGRSSGNVYLLA